MVIQEVKRVFNDDNEHTGYVLNGTRFITKRALDELQHYKAVELREWIDNGGVITDG